MYTIGQISEMFDLPISTLRYYDKEGLFPHMERISGARRFGDAEIEALRVIECLKRSGLEIKDIKRFMDWCTQGPSTFTDRLTLFQEQKTAVEEEIEHLKETLAILKYKCWYYEQAIADGNEERVLSTELKDMPPDIREAAQLLHGEAS